MINQKEKVKITLTCEQLDAIINSLDYVELDDKTEFIHNELKEVLNETNYGKRKIEALNEKFKNDNKIIDMDELRAFRDSNEFCKKYWHLI